MANIMDESLSKVLCSVLDFCISWHVNAFVGSVQTQYDRSIVKNQLHVIERCTINCREMLGNLNIAHQEMTKRLQ